mmetsp:Transcript_25179/g.54403  ORF Transcript_25179/g.54403 Transcript_25179/m.54403 type:complete len:152 (-) Transcript_25179:96-551(-)
MKDGGSDIGRSMGVSFLERSVELREQLGQIFDGLDALSARLSPPDPPLRFISLGDKSLHPALAVERVIGLGDGEIRARFESLDTKMRRGGEEMDASRTRALSDDDDDDQATPEELVCSGRDDTLATAMGAYRALRREAVEIARRSRGLRQA